MAADKVNQTNAMKHIVIEDIAATNVGMQDRVDVNGKTGMLKLNEKKNLDR